MKMKRTLNLWLMAALVCGLGLSVTSCKDDDDDDNSEQASTVTLDSELLTRGIETEMKNDAVDVKVTANGQWTATLKKGTEWVMIKDWQGTYEGTQTLTLLFDENTTGYDRTTTLTIGNSDGEYQTVGIRQTTLVDGQVPKNGSGLAFAGQGLGCGIDYDYALNVKNKTATTDQFDPTKVKKPNNIFNISYIEDLQKIGKLQPTAYQETEIQLTTMHADMVDSSMVKKKKFDSNLTLSCNFGPINFSAHGHYNSTKTQTESAVDYVITRYAPMYNVVVSPAEIRTYASDPVNNKLDPNSITTDASFDQIDALIAQYARINKRRRITDVNEDGLTPEQAEEIDAMYDQIPKSYTWGGVFSTNFTKSYNRLYSALKQKTPDYTAADQALNQLDNDFGPFFIAGGDYGGSIVVHCHATDRMLDGTGSFDGKISADMSSAFTFNMEGDFSLTDTGQDWFHEAHPDFYIYGGNANETANGLWDIVMSSKLDDRAKWSETLKNWVNSMFTTSDNKPIMSQAAPLSFVIECIWTLFDDPVLQEYAQNYFIKKYEDRGIKGYLGIATGLVKAPTADQLFTAGSDFHENGKKLDIPLVSNASGNYNQAEDNN